MRDLEKVKVERIPVPKLPEGHKREKPEPGVLGVELNLASIKTLITFLWERLFGKTTELELEVENVSIKLKVGSRKDLSAAIQDVEKLIRSVSEINDG